jgi:hypothetical protein
VHHAAQKRATSLSVATGSSAYKRGRELRTKCANRVAASCDPDSTERCVFCAGRPPAGSLNFARGFKWWKTTRSVPSGPHGTNYLVAASRQTGPPSHMRVRCRNLIEKLVRPAFSKQLTWHQRSHATQPPPPLPPPPSRRHPAAATQSPPHPPPQRPTNPRKKVRAAPGVHRGAVGCGEPGPRNRSSNGW